MNSLGRPNARLLATLVLPAFMLAALLSGCGREQKSRRLPVRNAPTAGPILLIGVDGLEWDVVLPLLAEGRLPNLAKLMQRGSFGLLETFRPTYSPIVWTSVATGKNRDKHGILHFVRRDFVGNPVLYSSTDRRTKAVWNILSDYGRRVCTVGWWMTYPVEQVNGVMVAQTNTVAQLETRHGKHVWKGTLLRGVPGQVYPPQRQNEMISVLEDVERELPDLTKQIFGEFPHPLSLLGRRLWSNCQWAFRADLTYSRIASRLLKQDPPFDLTMVYFGGPDVVGHRFWRYAHPDIYRHKPSPEQIENFGTVIDDYYACVDAAIGQLLVACDPKVTVMIVSDHGMKPINLGARFDPDDPPADVNSAEHQDAPPGVFVAAGSCIRWSPLAKSPQSLQTADLPTVGSVLDITPTILALLRIPVGKDMDGRVLAHVIRADFEPSAQPEPIDTHDTPEFFANRPELPPVIPGQEERLQQLRSLGYIDDDGD